MPQRVIAAWKNGKPIPTSIIGLKDRQEINEKHKKALKDEPMWCMFGGTIEISSGIKVQIG